MVPKKREELLDLIPAYVLGALDEDEHAEFETWLQNDSEAQLILADYQAITNHLVALAPFRAAPDYLRADMRQRLAIDPDRARSPTGTKSETIWARLGRRRWMIAVAAALLTVVMLGVLITQLNPGDDSRQTLNAEQLYDHLRSLPDATQVAAVPGEVDDAVSGRLVISPDGKQAVLCLWDLPPITTDQTFQMWLVDSKGARTSGGLFQGDTSQEAVYIQVPFDQPVTGYRGVGVSLEPAGGSPYADQPTGPRVLSVPLE